MDFPERYEKLTPDRVFASLSEGEAGYRAAAEVYEAEILPYFDEYVEAMEGDFGYAGFSGAFADPSGAPGLLEPAGFADFLSALAENYGGDLPEWDAASSAVPEPDRSEAARDAGIAADKRVKILSIDAAYVPGVRVVPSDDPGRLRVEFHPPDLLPDAVPVTLSAPPVRIEPAGGYELRFHEPDVSGAGLTLTFNDEGRLRTAVFLRGSNAVCEYGFDGSRLLYEKNLRWFKPPGTWIDNGGTGFQFTLYPAGGGALDPRSAYDALPEDEFVGFVASALATPEAYRAFESAFLCENHRDENLSIFIDERTLLALRAHGRGLFGIAAIEERIERRYGIAIETENDDRFLFSKSGGYLYDRMSLLALKAALETLEKGLARYPRAFLDAAALKRVGVFDHIRDTEGERDLAGFASGGYVVFNGAFSTLDHEIRHCADAADGFDDDDTEWALAAHGADYETAVFRATAPGVHPGFASDYGLDGNRDSPSEKESSVVTFREDQAEVGEALWHDREDLFKSAATDPALAAKIRLSESFYYARSGGAMDAVFWRDVASGVPIDAAYWARRCDEDAVKREYFGLSEFAEDVDGARRIEAERLEAEAERLFTWGDPYRALAIYRCLAQEFPREPRYDERMAELVFVLEASPTAAVARYKDAIRKGTRNPETYSRMTACLRLLDWGRRGLAIREYQALADEGVRNPALFSELAGLYLDSGATAKALLLYEMKVDSCRVGAGPDAAYVYYYADFLKRRRGGFSEREIDGAVKFIVAHARHAEPAGAFYGTVETLAEIGKQAEAKALLEKALAARPEDTYLKGRLEKWNADSGKVTTPD